MCPGLSRRLSSPSQHRTSPDQASYQWDSLFSLPGMLSTEQTYSFSLGAVIMSVSSQTSLPHIQSLTAPLFSQSPAISDLPNSLLQLENGLHSVKPILLRICQSLNQQLGCAQLCTGRGSHSGSSIFVPLLQAHPTCFAAYFGEVPLSHSWISATRQAQILPLPWPHLVLQPP